LDFSGARRLLVCISDADILPEEISGLKKSMSGRARLGPSGVMFAIALWLLGAGIYLGSLYFGYRTSFLAGLFTPDFPFTGPLYWMWAVWTTAGAFFNPLAITCLVWIGLATLSAILLAKTDT
jgi:hypothetical protein